MINLSPEEKFSFIAQRYLDFDFKKFDIKKPNFNKTLENELDSYINLSDEKNLQAWWEDLKLFGTKVEDFKERIFETKSGKVLMGIRFLGMDINRPFINVWTSFPIEKELQDIIMFAKKSFAIFKPKQIKFWSNPNSILAKENKIHICQNYLVGNIDEICQSTFPINFDAIELEQINDLSFFEWYSELYEKFHEKNPDLKPYVTVNMKTIFKDSIAQNLCYYIKFKDTKIGIIAAEKDHYFGVDSIYINEIIIEEKFKGKKLATASQRKLIELNKNQFRFIWGNIDSKNIPSIKNAFKIGRKIISSEILLPI